MANKYVVSIWSDLGWKEVKLPDGTGPDFAAKKEAQATVDKLVVEMGHPPTDFRIHKIP